MMLKWFCKIGLHFKPTKAVLTIGNDKYEASTCGYCGLCLNIGEMLK